MKKLETKVYSLIKKHWTEKGYWYIRLEQTAIPDILLVKQNKVLFIEVKTAASFDIKKVSWRPGQLAFAKRSLRYGVHWKLAIYNSEKKAIRYFSADYVIKELT